MYYININNESIVELINAFNFITIEIYCNFVQFRLPPFRFGTTQGGVYVDSFSFEWSYVSIALTRRQYNRCKVAHIISNFLEILYFRGCRF